MAPLACTGELLDDGIVGVHDASWCAIDTDYRRLTEDTSRKRPRRDRLSELLNCRANTAIRPVDLPAR